MAFKNYKYDPYVREWNRIADGGEICSGNFDPRNNPGDRRRLIACMLAAAAFIILFVMFSGCSRKVYVPVHRTTTVTELLRDTVVEVMLETVHDTVTVHPSGRDTASYLQDGTHFSHATWKNGMLGHSLGTLPGAAVLGTIPVRHVIIRDSIPYPVEIEKELTWWQQAKMEYGGMAMGAAAAFGMAVVIMTRSARNRRNNAIEQ